MLKDQLVTMLRVSDENTSYLVILLARRDSW